MIIGCTSLRGFFVGGNANNTSNAGFTYVNSNNSVANTNTNISGHLSYKNNNTCRPYLSVKNIFLINALVEKSKKSNIIAQ